jgi:hypothetical protein
MIVWQGYGILVPVILAATWILIPISLRAVIPDTAFTPYFKYISAFSLFLGALAVWFVGRKLNCGKGLELLNEKTGEKIVLKSKHTLFFIKMEYWSIPALLFLVFILI